MARVLLIRHAPTADTGVRLTGRRQGSHLSDSQPARDLGERLSTIRLAAIYASPLERTWETAEILSENRQLSPEKHPGLLEVDFGSWTGRTLTQLASLKAWQQVQLAPSRFRFPGGESFVEVQERVVSALEAIAVLHPKGVAAAVTHADVIRLALAHYLGMSIDQFQRLQVATASVSVVDLEGGLPARVAAINGNGDPATWQ